MIPKVLRKPQYRNTFLIISLGIFILLGSMLIILGFVPSELINTEKTELIPQSNVSTSTTVVANVIPVRIVISSVGIDTSVSHPQSQDVEILDQALLKGAVYYPGSGSLTDGNALVFAHSTGLSVVRNQAFKAFNNLKKVQIGDEIRVYGDDGQIYIYKALSMNLVTEDAELVEFNTTDRMITLSTCNTFGKKQERHVVKAQFIRVESN